MFKILKKSFKKGIVCFFITPILFLYLYLGVGYLEWTSETEVPRYISAIIEARYSVDAFYYLIGISVFVILSILFLNKTYFLPKLEIIVATKLLKFLGVLCANFLLFMSGTLLSVGVAPFIFGFFPDVNLIRMVSDSTLLIIFAAVLSFTFSQIRIFLVNESRKGVRVKLL